MPRWFSRVLVGATSMASLCGGTTEWRVAQPQSIDPMSMHPASEMAAANRGEVVASFNTALREHRLLDQRPVQDRDPAVVLRWYETAALGGHAPALVNLGGAMETGWGCLPDPAGGLNNYDLAALLGHPLGDYNYARAAILNPELADTSAAALSPRLDRAATGGIREAAYLRGWMELQEGRSEEAGSWFLSAARQGLPEAQFALGWLHASSRLNGASRGEGLRWLEEADAGGHPLAPYLLARLHQEGTDQLGPDYRKAALYLERSAQAGVAEACYSLGLYRYWGRGGRRDLVDSYRWLTVAGRTGLTAAQRALNRLARQLTPQQLKEGAQRVQETPPSPPRTFAWSTTASRASRMGAASTVLPGLVVGEGWVVGWGQTLPAPPARGRISTASGTVACRETQRSTRHGLLLMRVEGTPPPWSPVRIKEGGQTGRSEVPARLAALDLSSPAQTERWYARVTWDGREIRNLASLPPNLRHGAVLDRDGRLLALVGGEPAEPQQIVAADLLSFLRQAGWIAPAPGVTARANEALAGSSTEGEHFPGDFSSSLVLLTFPALP